MFNMSGPSTLSFYCMNSLAVNRFFKCKAFNTVHQNRISELRPFSGYTLKRREEPPWRVLFFGTDDFSLASLVPLTSKLHTGTLMSSLGVISDPDTPVHKFAKAENLQIHDWPPDNEILKNYDIGMVVSYGKLIPAKVIDAVPLGILNVHGSLLPRWRGASPIEYAILNGDMETGVTVMRIKPHKFDVGDIVRQYRCSISPNETTPELRSRLATYGSQLLMECIRDLPRCVDMTTAQPEEGITYAPKLTSTLAKVDWNVLTAKDVYNRHRALAHAIPLSTKWFNSLIKLHDISLAPEDKPQLKQQVTAATNKSALDFLNDVKVSDSKPVEKTKDIVPGRIMFSYKMKVLKIQCSDGAWVTCDKIKVLKSRIMSGSDFYNGFLSKKDRESWIFG